jgi:hypothetical protein
VWALERGSSGGIKGNIFVTKSCLGERVKAYNILCGHPAGRRPLGKRYNKKQERNVIKK